MRWYFSLCAVSLNFTVTGSSYWSICRLDLDFLQKKTLLSIYSSFYPILLSLVPFAMPVCHSFLLCVPSPRFPLLQACLCTQSPSPTSSVLHVQDGFSSSPSNPFPPASFFPCSNPILFPFTFFSLTLFPPVLPHFSSSCPYLAFCMASSPHISMLFIPPCPLPGSLAGLFSSPCVLPVCTCVSTDSPSCSRFPCPSYQYPDFFSAPSCVHILHAWKKEPPGRLKPSPVVLVFFPQESACTFG